MYVLACDGVITASELATVPDAYVISQSPLDPYTPAPYIGPICSGVWAMVEIPAPPPAATLADVNSLLPPTLILFSLAWVFRLIHRKFLR